MDTKQKGDISEQAATLFALKQGWGVLNPIGDRLPYDLVFDVNGKLVKLQVKSAWLDKNSNNYIVDVRQTKTNRKKMIRKYYTKDDFDFAILYIEDLDVFYIMPVEVFISYKSTIALVEVDKRQRKPKSSEYKNNWELINVWAAKSETI